MAICDVMKREHKARSGLALGGIGAGWFELRKDGCFYNWSIFNNEPWGTGPRFDWREDSMLFFIVRYQEKGAHPRMKLLQVDQGEEVASIPSHIYTFPWLSGVDEIEYEASFPFTRMRFRDADMPLVVELEAFSPFIPHDPMHSSLPAAVFNFRLTSTTKNPVDVMLLASWRNAAGFDTPDRHYVSKIHEGRGYRAFEMTCGGMDRKHDTFGAQVMASLSADSTYWLGWEHRHPYYEYVIRHGRLNDFDDTAGRNARDRETGRQKAMYRAWSSIARSKRLRGLGRLDHTFVATWHFPNLYCGRTHKAKQLGVQKQRRIEGHFYNRHFSGAAEVADYVIGRRKKLESQSRAFHDALFDSTLPSDVLDQVNSHLNTFFTSSWFTEAGDFGIQEGMTRSRNWGPLATIDVGMYGSVSAAALFPSLDQAMMRAHKRLQAESGAICHGIGRDFTIHDVHEQVSGRLDLPSQYAIMALRGYFWTGDRAYLEEMWPSVKAALEYVLRERDANGDELPDMAGAMCTYDNFPMYGAASYVASLWLAALAYAAEAGRHLGDTEAAERYDAIRQRATRVFEEKLWNGSYYRLYNDAGGPRGDLDDGCLTDQIIGQWAMHHAGLGNLLKRQRVGRALKSIMERAYLPDYGLLNCRWPGVDFIMDVPEDCWSDQANTCWSGVELAFASLLIYEGKVRDGLKVIRNVDQRYRKAGLYFDHQEFGGHYYRPMSAWADLGALLGLAIDGQRYTFDPRLPDRDQKILFAYGAGYGHYERRSTGRGDTVTLTPHTGTFVCRELTLGLSSKAGHGVTVRRAGKPMKQAGYDADVEGRTVTVRFRRPVKIGPGRSLSVQVR